MANRTIQFWGQGYAPTGTDPIVITATLDGNVVYTGDIPTLYTSDVNHLSTAQVVLFTFEVPMTYAGTFPMSISLDSPVGVDAFFEGIFSNYLPMPNPVYPQGKFSFVTNPTTTQAEKVAVWTSLAVPPLDAAEITILETGTQVEIDAVLLSHNIELYVSSGADTFNNIAGDSPDPRTNVVINGVAVTRGDTPTGCWGWEVEFPAEGSGSIDCDLTFITGIPPV